MVISKQLLYQDSHLHHYDTVVTTTTIENFIQQAKGAGVTRLLINTARLDEWDDAIKYSESDDIISTYLGIHPWYADEIPSNFLEKLEPLIKTFNFGIGEIGLDKSCNTSIENQEHIFDQQFQLACKYNRPVSIHCIGRWGYMAEYLAKQKSCPPIILHSFNSSLEMAERFVKLGCHLSFSLKLLNNKKTQNIVERIPLNRLLLESDRNNKAEENSKYDKWANNLINSYHIVAKIKQLPLKILAQELWINGTIFKT
ncbi:MAG: TatD family hydrolase [Desulfotalea sp.]